MLKLECSKQAPAAFKDKLTSFFKSKKNFKAVNDARTIWMLTQGSSVINTACYIDDVLHFIMTRNYIVYFVNLLRNNSMLISLPILSMYISAMKWLLTSQKRRLLFLKSLYHVVLGSLWLFQLQWCWSSTLWTSFKFVAAFYSSCRRLYCLSWNGLIIFALCCTMDQTRYQLLSPRLWALSFCFQSWKSTFGTGQTDFSLPF